MGVIGQFFYFISKVPITGVFALYGVRLEFFFACPEVFL